MMNAQVESMPMGAPNGSRKTRGTHEMMATAAPSLGPKASAAMRQTIPEGSYMSHGAAGKMGICTKLSTSDAAVKRAASAIFLVLTCVVDELLMAVASVSSIRTVPSALESHQVSRLRGSRASGALCPLQPRGPAGFAPTCQLPPVGNCTQP